MTEHAPWRGLVAPDSVAPNVVILGIPFDGNVSVGKGAAQAPERCRYLSAYLPPVTENGTALTHIRLHDLGDITLQIREPAEAYFKRVNEAAKKILAGPAFPIFIGGDHSVSIPLRKAFAQRYAHHKIGLIHFDAHADICAVYNGSPLSHASVNARSLEDGFKDDALLMAGIRSFELQELTAFADHPHIRLLKACDLVDTSPRQLAERIAQYFAGVEALYFSLDIDVLDPAYAPGTGTPESGGWTTRYLLDTVRAMFGLLPIKAFDLVEVAPPLDTNDVTTWAGLKVLLEILAFVK